MNRSALTALRRLALTTRRATAAVVTSAVVVTGLVAVPALPATAATGTVTGTVFLDINGDGVYQPSGTPAERPFAGVTVKAFDTSSTTTAVATAVSEASGAYTLTLAGTASNKLRIEFELSEDQKAQGYEHSRAVLSGSVPAGQVASGSSVQFVDLTAPVHTASFGVSHPDDYNPGTAALLVPVHNPGNPLTTTGSERGLVQVAANASGQGRELQTQLSATNAGSSYGTGVGLVWGNAYDKEAKVAYNSALMRRFGGFGAANLGGIYRTDVTTSTTTAWIDLEAAGIDVGGGVLDAALGLPTGSSASARNTARGLLANPATPIRDDKAFGLPGRIGLGAMVLDPRTSTVFVTNLFRKTIIAIPVAADGSAGTPTEITLPGLDAANDVPFGLHIYRNSLYVGITDTASTTAGAAADRASLGARVLSAPIAQLSAGTWTERLAVNDLTFQRGASDISFTQANNNSGLNDAKVDRGTHWNAWSDNWTGVVGPACIKNSDASKQERFCSFAQPVLSAIDFDSAGNMILGFADRFAWQSADGQYAPSTSDSYIHFTFSSGDIYLAGLKADGTFGLESAAAITSVTGTKAATWTDPGGFVGSWGSVANFPNTSATTGRQGPGGGEFFYDRNRPTMNDTGTASHYESTTGALATLAGINSFPVTAYSTQGSQNGQFYGSGPKWLNAATGVSERAYDVVRQSDLGTFPNVRAFGKAGGLGDLQFLVAAAPVQIGNYVWFDADKDGVQGPEEPALPGVTVNLVQDGTIIGTRTTDANGQYYFSSTDLDLVGKLVPNGGDYTLVFVAPTTGTVDLPGAPGTAWASLKLTTPLAGSPITDSTPDPTTGRHTFTVGGPGENDHSYDAGYVIRNGALSVTKTVTGTGADAVPEDFEFSVNYSYGSPAVTGTLTVSKANPTASLAGLPTGTVVTLAEAAPGDAGPSVEWGAPVFSGTGVTVNENGSARLTIGDGTTVAVGLENPATLLEGGFSVTKAVTGGAAGAVDGDFEFTVGYSYGSPAVTGTLTVSKDAPTAGLSELPTGTVVTVSEVAPGDAGESVEWGTPVFSGPGVTVNPDGSATFTIGDGTTVAVALTNPTTLLTGGFSVTKSVTGPAADVVADDFEFTVTYSYGSPAVTGSLVVSKDTPTDALDGLPVGTVVTLSEGPRLGADPSVSWGTPVFSGTGVTDNLDGTATFTIGDGTTVAVGLENPTTLLTQGFSVTKQVTGTGTAHVPDDFEFTVTYAYGSQSGELVLSKANSSATVTDLPTGTVVTLTEATPGDAGPSVGWGTPVFSGTGVTVHADGSATFTIDDDTAVAVTLTNPATLLTGGLEVTKSVTGGAADVVADDFEFTVNYSYGTPAVTGTLTVSKGDPSAALTDLPAGTVVTLSEVAPGDAGPSVGWGTPVFSGTGVVVNQNGSATVTIGDGTTVAVALTNPTTLLTGGFEVTKSVTGGAADAVADDFEFTVGYSYGSPAVTGTLIVSKDAPTAGLSELPTGTVVTVSEVVPGDAGESVEWGTPVFSGPGVTANLDGSASFTIGDDTTVAVTLTNPTTLLTGGFEITKSVTGGAADVVGDDFEFTVTYSYGTPEVTGTLAVSKANPTAGLSDLPAGTVVTLSEATPDGAGPSVGWGAPVFSGPGVEVDLDGSATITIGDGTTVAVALENPTTLLTGGFEVTKSVTGPAAGAVDDDFEFTVNYSHGTPEVTGTLTVSKADPTAGLSGLPAGTVVTLTEAPRLGADPSVSWGTPVFTGAGVTDDGEGSATVTIGDGTTVEVGLENPTTLITQGFSVTKVVSGTGASAVPDDFEFTVTYSYGSPATTGQLLLTPADPAAGLSNLPAGTVVTLTEAAPGDAGPSIEWGTPVFSGTGVTAHDDGSATFTIGDDTAVAITLTNPATLLTGGVEVTKEIIGGAAGQLDGWSVEVDYSYGTTPTTGTIVLSDATPSGGLADLPAGTVITLSEGAVTGAPAGAVWGTAVWTVDGVAVAPSVAGEITVTVGPDTDVAVLLQNPIENPEVSIVKGDSGDLGTGSTVVNDADTMADGQVYAPGETRRVVFSPTNSGTEALVDVIVTDSTLSGGAVEDMRCLFPGATGYTAGVQGADGWTVTWAESDSSLTDPATWGTHVTFSCDATLTLTAASRPHVDSGAVSGTGVASGKTVTAENPYNAFTAAIQLIKYDGNLPDPVVKDGSDWIVPSKPLADPDQDANDVEHAVLYPSGTPQPVRWVVTNTGPTYLTNLTLTDVTGDGPDIGAWVCDLAPVGGTTGYSFLDDGAWAGAFAPGESFFCEGPLTLPELTDHQDTVTVVGEVVVPEVDELGVPTGNPSRDDDGLVVARDGDDPWTVTDDDPFNAYTVEDLVPEVSIIKGDAGAGRTTPTIVNDANTMDDGEFFTPGETRTIVFRPTNTGTEPLVDVSVTDATISGGQVQDMSCTFPGDTTPTAAVVQPDGSPKAVWTASAAGAVGGVTWLPTESFSCSATLTIEGTHAPHADSATVTGTGVGSGTVVTAEDPYYAFSAQIQLIKYDGNRADPAVRDGSDWIVPAKPLTDGGQDANDTEHSVLYPSGKAQRVRWVVTNTGTTHLTNLTLIDVTGAGPDIGAWLCDLAPVGGATGYSFLDEGAWAGVLAPGESFFCEGPLTLPEETTHQDTVTVVGEVVVPEVDEVGVPTGNPSLGEGGKPVLALDAEENPWTVTDNDPFNAHTVTDLVPEVSIVKGDTGSDRAGTSVVNDANTMKDGEFYAPGETRTIVFTPTNTGTEPLVDVSVTDTTISGGQVQMMSCTFPGATAPTAGTVDGDGLWTVTWAQSASSLAVPATWLPTVSFGCTATLTVHAAQAPHVDTATVYGTGVSSGTVVSAEDPYAAFSAAIQVIKYDGELADPAVKDSSGAWIIPSKPLVDAGQDANDAEHAVSYTADAARTVRWVVTNTGSTYLTSLRLSDVTGTGPSIGAWTCDLAPVGGVTGYSFTTSGAWTGLFAPGQSFFCEGPLTLGANTAHQDTVTVVADVVVPAVDENGKPTGKPSLNPDGTPVVALDRTGKPVTVSDDDPFNARTPAGLLPITGAELAQVAFAALAAALLGSVLLLLVRSRRRQGDDAASLDA